MFDTAEIIKRLLLLTTGPKAAWNAISGEAFELRDLYSQFLLPLIVLGALSSFAGLVIFGPISVLTGLQMFLLLVVIGLASPFIAVLVLSILVPYFGGEADRDRICTFFTFSILPLAACCLLNILPPLSVITAVRTAVFSAAGLHFLYLVWTGIPPMLGVSVDRRAECFMAYLSALIFAAAALYFMGMYYLAE